jgi:hypothetical protein
LIAIVFDPAGARKPGCAVGFRQSSAAIRSRGRFRSRISAATAEAVDLT